MNLVHLISGIDFVHLISGLDLVHLISGMDLVHLISGAESATCWLNIRVRGPGSSHLTWPGSSHFSSHATCTDTWVRSKRGRVEFSDYFSNGHFSRERCNLEMQFMLCSLVNF